MDSVTQLVAETLQTDQDTASLVLGAALVVLISTLLLLLFLGRRGAKGRTMLIVGLSDAGKTAIFSKLVTGVTCDTYTSMKENECVDVQFGKSVFSLVDVPGADKLRRRLLRERLESSGGSLCGVLCVLDSVSFTKAARDVAELLYDTLCSCPTRVPIMVACNKQDMTLAKSAQAIRSSLEKELSLLNKSRAASLGLTDERGQSTKTLCKAGKEFSWKALGRPVQFCECSAVEAEESDLSAVEQWLESV